MANIIELDKFKKDLISKINDIIKNSDYHEICNYLELLPELTWSEEKLYDCGISYINDYYKKIAKLEKIKNDNNEDEIKKIQFKIYTLYNMINYEKIHLSFQEFIVFSKLMDATFTNYNPNKKRSFVKPYESQDLDMNYIINSIQDEIYYKDKEHAFEITRLRLEILYKTLKEKGIEIIKENLKDIEVEKIIEEFNIKNPQKLNREILNLYKYNNFPGLL